MMVCFTCTSENEIKGLDVDESPVGNAEDLDKEPEVRIKSKKEKERERKERQKQQAKKQNESKKKADEALLQAVTPVETTPTVESEDSKKKKGQKATKKGVPVAALRELMLARKAAEEEARLLEEAEKARLEEIRIKEEEEERLREEVKQKKKEKERVISFCI